MFRMKSLFVVSIQEKSRDMYMNWFEFSECDNYVISKALKCRIDQP